MKKSRFVRSMRIRKKFSPGQKKFTRKNVAIHLPGMYGGGAERTFVTVANGLVRAGFAVTFVLNSEFQNYLDELSENVGVIYLGQKPKRVGKSVIGDIPRRTRTLMALTHYLFSHRPDFLLAALPESIIHATIANIFTGRQTQLVASQRNAFSKQHEKQGFLSLTNRKLVAWSLKKADKVVAPSDGVALDLIEKAGVSEGNILVINNPVIDSNFIEKSEELVDDPWFDSNLKKFIFVGRLESVKRVHDIIHAFSKVIEDKPSLLAIVGKGSLRDELEQIVESLGLKKSVKFYDFEPSPYKLMKASDCLILASEHEGFPNVLVQSMAVGTQIIASDCKFGPAEILVEGQYGRLFPVGDVEKLARHMLESIEFPEPSDRLIKRASVFSWEIVGKNWISLLSENE